MKKVTAIFTSALMFASAFAFVSCKKDDEPQKKVMNISCNPSVEFVLDSDDTVISVNALNEEGNLIVSAEAFTGKSAEEAAKLFIEVSNETGFLVSGNASVAGNEISISLSGDAKEATKLYDEVKAEINEYLSAENIEAQLTQAAAITEEQLEKLVEQCTPYMDAAEVRALEYMELVETLYQSRKETAELYSQELKNAYYEAKAFALEQAELEILKSKVTGGEAVLLEVVYTAYTGAIETIETARMSGLVAENSPYQLALKAFREAKVAYLNYRREVAEMEQNSVTTAITEQLNALEGKVNSAEEALLLAGETANAALTTLKERVTAAYNNVVEKIEEASIKAADHLEEISAKQTAAITALSTDFEDAYAGAIAAARTNWTTMKTQLQESAQPAA